MNYHLFHGKIMKYLKQISNSNTCRAVKKRMSIVLLIV